MFALRSARLQKSTAGTSERRRQWEERVAGLLAVQEQKAASISANRYADKYERKQYTSVQQAFPEIEPSRFAALAKMKAAADSPPNAKVHVATVVGPPNAGKSSLINALTHRLFSSEGQSAGTTQAVKRCSTSVGTSQLVFLDTPGLSPPKGPARHQHMRDLSSTVWDSFQGANSILACIPVHNNGFLDSDHKVCLQHIARRALSRDMPIDLVVTMMDKVSTPKLKDYYFAMRSEIEGLGIPIRKSFETSTRNSKGLVEIKDYLASVAKPSPWEAEERGRDQLTSTQEIIRQALFTHLPIPIPYTAAPHIVGWTKRPDRSVEVFVEVFFDRPSSMAVFFSKVGLISKDCDLMATREFENRFKFVFQGFVSASGTKH